MDRLKLLRVLAAASFVVGLAFVMLAAACSGGDDDSAPESPVPSETATPTRTPTNTPTATPTATPTPFDGKVARMIIPDLGVDHPIEEVGINPVNNQMETPKDATGAIGWYYTFPKPGFGKNSVYSAHVNYNGRNGPFARLAEATYGTRIVIQMADGPEYTYEVFDNVRYSIYDIPMGPIIDRPGKPENEEWITLITCSCEPGRVLDPDGDGFGECLDRDVVTARRVS